MGNDDIVYYLSELGYDRAFAELCQKSMVSRESFIEHIIDVLHECYDNSMAQIEGVSDDFRSFIEYSLKHELCDLSPHIFAKPYSGYSVLNDSSLFRRAFAIHGGVYFVIFDDETNESINHTDFNDILDFIISHNKANEEIESAIKLFS